MPTHDPTEDERAAQRRHRLDLLRARVRRALLRGGQSPATKMTVGFSLESIHDSDLLRYEVVVRSTIPASVEPAPEQEELGDTLLAYETALHEAGINTRLAHDAESILVNLWDQ